MNLYRIPFVRRIKTGELFENIMNNSGEDFNRIDNLDTKFIICLNILQQHYRHASVSLIAEHFRCSTRDIFDALDRLYAPSNLYKLWEAAINKNSNELLQHPVLLEEISKIYLSESRVSDYLKNLRMLENNVTELRHFSFTFRRMERIMKPFLSKSESVFRAPS